MTDLPSLKPIELIRKLRKAKGTLRAIIREAGLTVEEFVRL